MVIIRFLRTGRKHQPSYKIVAVDRRKSPKSGKFIEQLGFYNPLTKEKSVNKERVGYWLSMGAQVSGTVHNLLVAEGILEGEKKAVHSAKKKEAEAEAQKAEAGEPKAEESVSGEEVEQGAESEAETEEKQEVPAGEPEKKESPEKEEEKPVQKAEDAPEEKKEEKAA